MDNNTAIPILLDDAFYQLRVRKDIYWEPERTPILSWWVPLAPARHIYANFFLEKLQSIIQIVSLSYAT